MPKITPPPPTPFKPPAYQTDILNQIKEQRISWPRRMGSRAYPKPFVGIDISAKEGDKSVAVHGIPDKNGGFTVIAIDEWGTWPDWKWYRNPIKWWKFRRINKIIERNSSGKYVYAHDRHNKKNR